MAQTFNDLRNYGPKFFKFVICRIMGTNPPPNECTLSLHSADPLTKTASDYVSSLQCAKMVTLETVDDISGE